VAAAAPAPVVAPVVPQPIIRPPISTYGAEVDDLFFLILGITLVAMVAVEVLMVVFIVRYRHRPGRKATYVHGHNKLEVFWTVATAFILIFLVFKQRATWIKIKETLPSEDEKPFLVRVFGEQFIWHFVYPGEDGNFELNHTTDIFPGENPLGLANPKADVYRPALLVPVNTKVVLELNSLPKYDPNAPEGAKKETLPVLHGFYAPVLRFKQDIIPFHPAKIWFEATKTGTYEIACAELCGLGHYTMRADFKVMEPKELADALGYDWQARPASFRGLEDARAREKAQSLEKKEGGD
jgi:cytochrome c oxidase subunit 2